MENNSNVLSTTLKYIWEICFTAVIHLKRIPSPCTRSSSPSPQCMAQCAPSSMKLTKRCCALRTACFWALYTQMKPLRQPQGSRGRIGGPGMTHPAASSVSKLVSQDPVQTEGAHSMEDGPVLLWGCIGAGRKYGGPRIIADAGVMKAQGGVLNVGL
ncbi:hypothetical protein BD779DRAFT_1537246 [Infundibulicybe gibba]|nr:hypothetical protein BD779DRAFT_1537246 [Infundibulicybe gibba]